MLKTRLLGAVLVAEMSLAVCAKPYTVDVWRGETAARIVPDNIKLEKPSECLDLKVGILHPVKCAPKPNSLLRTECLDRIQWGSGDGGVRVVEIHAPEDAKPGLYPCGMMNVRVIDRVLPPSSQWRYFLDLWQHPWAVSRYFNVKPFSREHYALMKPVWETLATAGQKTLTVTITDKPWNHQCYDAYESMIGRVKTKHGKWRFDYSLFDEYVAFGKKCGLGPKISCYTICPWENIVRWHDESGVQHSMVAKPGSPEFEEYWGAFLVDFASHLKQKGWFECTYIAMDETLLDDVRLIANFIQKTAPGMKISMARSRLPSEYGVVIDNYSAILNKRVDETYIKEAAERRTNDLITTFYVCCGPRYPNTFLSSGPGEAFWLGVFPAMSGLDGFLRWAWNSWPYDPVVDASYGRWLAGDTFLVYPDGSPSWRFLELRNGIATAEKIRILKENGMLPEGFQELASKFKPKEASAGKSDYVKLKDESLMFVNF